MISYDEKIVDIYSYPADSRKFRCPMRVPALWPHLREYDSGKIKSDRSVLVAYESSPLKPTYEKCLSSFPSGHTELEVGSGDNLFTVSSRG